MTIPKTPATPAPGESKSNSTWMRASYRKSIAPGGSNALASPDPGAEGVDRHRGAPVHRDAAEGEPHPEGEQQHSCHTARCAHAAPQQPPVRQRERLRDENKRMRQPSCRMNDDEYQLLLRAASACRMSVASFLAHAALKAARDLDRTAAEIATEREVVGELFALRRHLGQIGNNLNQVAKATNSGADVPHTRTVLDAVHRAAKRVETFTQHVVDDQSHAA
ncbi:plasmid mobilization protein [Streptomyces sp. NPDC021100]|uniref:plasmid mobilization protein n=1 Tax=Streptomyces sp. NPDC021100 TaxID=3365114 RepID=UPI00378DADAA